jgi:Protein of unknown function (DUF2568)
MGADEQRDSGTGVLQVGAFFAEILMLIALVYVGVATPASLIGRVVLAIALPLAVSATWSRWLAPRAPRQLPPRPGLALKVALFAVTAVLLGLVGSIALAVVFLVVTEGVVIAAELARRPR